MQIGAAGLKYVDYKFMYKWDKKVQAERERGKDNKSSRLVDETVEPVVTGIPD